MTRRTLLALAAGAAFAAERKNRAPVSWQSLAPKVPEAAAVKLSNGLTLLAIEDSRFPLVWASYRVDGAGAIYAPPGLAPVTAELLDGGAGARSGQQISEDAASLGAYIQCRADPGEETAAVDCSGLSGQFDRWLELLTDVLVHPTFPADEFNSVRQRRLVGARLRSAEPANQAGEAMRGLIYGSHPAGIVTPPAEALQSLTPEMVANWHRERYTPGATVLTVIGRVKPAAVAARVEALTAGWKTPEAKYSLPPAPQPAAKKQVLVIGGLLFDRRDPGYFAMQVANEVLGASDASRLPQILSQEKGYAVFAASAYRVYRYPGYWTVRATVRTDATADSVAIILAQLRRLCDEPIPATELEEAKASLIGQFALSLEKPQQVINYSYERNRYGFSANYWERDPAMVGGTTAAEVQAVAQKYLNPDKVQIVAVGDRTKIKL